MRILVSACLAGLNTRYDGGHCLSPELAGLASRHTLVPVCPEQLGGLPTPRPPCEIVSCRVLGASGQDRTAAFEQGADQALAICRFSGCGAAILKARSPSCGKGLVYDGSFSGKLVPGNGVLAEKLLRAGIPVYTEAELDDLQASSDFPCSGP